MSSTRQSGSQLRTVIGVTAAVTVAAILAISALLILAPGAEEEPTGLQAEAFKERLAEKLRQDIGELRRLIDEAEQQLETLDPSTEGSSILRTFGLALLWTSGIMFWLGTAWFIVMLLSRPGLARPIGLILIAFLISLIGAVAYTASGGTEDGASQSIFDVQGS